MLRCLVSLATRILLVANLSPNVSSAEDHALFEQSFKFVKSFLESACASIAIWYVTEHFSASLKCIFRAWDIAFLRSFLSHPARGFAPCSVGHFLFDSRMKSCVAAAANSLAHHFIHYRLQCITIQHHTLLQYSFAIVILLFVDDISELPGLCRD